MQLPIIIPVARSWRLLGLLTAVHVAALAVLAPLVLPAAVKLALALGIVGSASWFVTRTRRLRIRSLRLGARGELEVAAEVGAGESAVVLHQTTVLPGLIVLLLRIGGRREWLVLPADATGAAAHRQLRLWLRWRSESISA